MNKNNHPIEQEELMAYLDGELASERAAVAVSHLERCEECRELAADLKSVSEQMREWQVPEGPETMPELDAALEEDVIKQQLNAPIRRILRRMLDLRFPPRRMWGLAGASLSVAVVLIAVMSMRQFSPRA